MEVSDQIIKVLDEIGKKFGLAIDWTQNNITPYIQDLGQRIVKYEIFTSIAWIVIWSIVILSMVLIMIFLHKKTKGTNNYETVFYTGFLFAIIFILAITGIGEQTFDIIKALTLPETIWMDYLQQYLPK